MASFQKVVKGWRVQAFSSASATAGYSTTRHVPRIGQSSVSITEYVFPFLVTLLTCRIGRSSRGAQHADDTKSELR
jgi:hypothetical protein